MSALEQVTQAVYESIDEINRMPGIRRSLEKSPDTILIGDGGQLDSIVFVAFISVIEERFERLFKQSITVLDLFTEEMETSCTVTDLVRRLVEMVDGAHAGPLASSGGA